MTLILFLWWIITWLFQRQPFARARSRCRLTRPRAAPSNAGRHRFKPKPRWVTREVLRLKALMPHDGCRKIADAFNRRFALHWSAALRMRVGRSFVYEKVKAYGLEIIRLRRELKHRVPRPLPRNLIWAMDLTEVPDADGSYKLVLGVLDHGSRAVVALCEMADKRSITILRVLIEAMKRFGIPRAVRSDNESVFCSILLRSALFLLGIRHQRTNIASPWMNGRIERFFGTFKAAVQHAVTQGWWLETDANLADRLVEFRFFYNHIRPHQHLRGLTPAETWRGLTADTLTHPESEYWYAGWGGVLAGYYLRR